MRIRIYRSPDPSWSACVELSTADSRILVDPGIPVDPVEAEGFDWPKLRGANARTLRQWGILPDVRGLYKGDGKGIDAVLITRSHLHHYDLLKHIQPQIPLYMSAGAAELVSISDIFSPESAGRLTIRVPGKDRIAHGHAIKASSLFVDHRALDGVAYLIEGGGKKVLYSADPRGHRRGSSLFEAMLKRPPKGVDCLLINARAQAEAEEPITERQAQERIERVLKARKNISFLVCPAPDIDRCIAAYKACVACGALCVVDARTAFVMERLKAVYKEIPQFNWSSVAVHFLDYRADDLVKPEYRDQLFNYNKRRIDLAGIRERRQRTLLVTDTAGRFISLAERVGGLKMATVAFSGTAAPDESLSFCNGNGITVDQLPPVAGASAYDIRQFAEALDPRALAPLDAQASNSYTGPDERVKIVGANGDFEI